MHWVAVVLVIGAVASQLADGGYIFTAPKILRSETDALFRLTLTDVKEDGKVTVRLLKYNNDNVVLAEKEYDIKNGESVILPFRVPEHLDSRAKIKVNGTFGSYVFGDSKRISFKKSKNTILVQSDKALYKPGQKVRFRVLPINNELKPVTDVKATIYVTSPSDVRIAQWNNVSFEKGIVQRDFQLAEEPELGMWEVVVELPTQTARQHFEVKEYVLPKFEVTIKPPSYVLADAKEITWKICAQYTFGQPVDGTLTVNVTYEHYGWEKDDCPRINHTGPINGCYDMVVNTTLLRCNENYRVHRRISLVAQVNETGTGVTMNMTNFISRSFNPLELNFLDGEHGKNYFKPTMPFYGRLLVKKPDGIPVGGELVQLCLLEQSEEIKSRWGYTDRRLSCKNYTSEVSGIIKFTIRPLKTSVVTISIEAVAMNYETVKYSTYGVEINQPKSTLRLQAWYSPSSNFMQLEPSKGPIPCAGKHSVRLRYTGEPETQKRLHFQIMARGKILKDKVVDVAFNPDASFLVEEDLNAMLPSNMAGSPMSTGSFEFELEPDYSYVPRVKVLAFYVRPDGEVIADFEQFEVEKCLENNVTMRFGSEVVQPATSAAIHLYGSPHSYCGVGIVDKSVHLLKQDNQLTKDKDTVLGLQALAAFATFVSKDPVDITVKVDGNGISESYNLKEDTKLVVQEKKVVRLPNKLTSEATGPGCALVSTTLKYNVHAASKSEGFELTATPSQEATDCSDLKLNISIRYDGKKPSNMAVLELKLLSGYVPDENHIYSLYRGKDVKLKRHEVEKNQVNFYFEEITSENKRFDVRLHREFAIEDAKPATVKVYDYYEQENSNSVPYSLVVPC